MTATAADAFTTEVVRHALDTVAEEMRTSLHRTAMTVAVKDMLDYSCALFDARGRLLATALDLPTLLASMGPALRAAIEKWGDELAEGDVLMSNHPYQGGVHTSDINVFVPVFHAGALVAFAGTVAHHSDWGGRLPGTCSHSNLSVFEEGVMYPSVKLEEGGRPNRSIYDVIAANVRNPALNLGDLRAQIAAARTGERGLLRIVGKYGARALSEVVERLLAHAARRTRQEIAAMPDGVYEAEGFLDDDGVTRGEPVRIHVRATIAGEEIAIDLSGSSGQRLSGMNCPLSTTLSDVHYAVRCLMPADVPFNEGCLEPVTLTVPEGNLFNPRFPAATSDRHHTSQRLNDVLTRALVQAVPERGSAGWYVGWPALICETQSPKTGDRAVLLAQVAGGAGANAARDGADALDVHGANCAIVPAETVEMNYALRVERYELREDSGGAGLRRGGLGIRADYRILGEEEVFFIVEAEQGDPRFAPPGLDGGAPGAVGGLVLVRDGVEQPLEGKTEFSGRPGDVVSMRAGGGGGSGDPRSRAPEAVADDVRRGLVSPASAAADYGAQR